MSAPIPVSSCCDSQRDISPPAASVVMLTYNHAHFLGQAIESVLRQNFDGCFELVIGDDCSTDGTLEIALDYQRAYPGIVRVLSNKNNIGMHGNHARLVEACRGEFLAYCEGDDYWISPDKLKSQVEYLRANPICGAVHADFDRIARIGGVWKALPRSNSAIDRRIPTGEVFNPLLAGNFIQTCTLCVRTTLARAYLESDLPVSTYPVGDWPLCLYVARVSHVEYLDESMAVYRQVAGSMMNSGHLARLRMAQACLPMIESICSQFGIDMTTRKEAIASIQRSLLSFAALAADKTAFAEAHDWLQLHDPDYLRPLRRRLLPWIVHSAFACRLLAFAQEARAAIFSWRRYRAPAPAIAEYRK